MKVIRIDTAEGLQEVLTEKELKEQYTETEIQKFKSDKNTYMYETAYTVKQLKKARELKSDELYCYNFECDYCIAPSVYDILIVEYAL